MKVTIIQSKGQVSMEITLVIASILIFLPSIIWYLLKQAHSPWWLENTFSTPFIVLPIYIVLMFVLISLLSWQDCLGYLLINFIVALCLNSSGSFNNKTCVDPVSFFQFNIKYHEGENELAELIAHLKAEHYHLITLQGVSQQAKRQLIAQLTPYFPYFVSGESQRQQIFSDQLLFSRYPFTHIKYYKSGHSAFLITSRWQLPVNDINLLTLHPPSPRNEKLWQTRNKTLYQLKQSLKTTPLTKSLVIGDLNLSKHSRRMDKLMVGMKSEFVNSWPNIPYSLPVFGLAIDHFWLSAPANICSRQRISQFSWSDHYAVKTQVDFSK
ncbi:hypothetical protein CMT41_06500 [Colwellia sp. MT41]|uniref:endonuclease/exonuclease/phosphatase family protein n=1 Tax=Colwellia sp. MT41 TaxID=58049 RepID=UPI00071785FF|nr:endonuclease/exonuclease/phosphatase family protein [Colwellia sp. MT41]ALO34407.1 hypothetical protein CMT41_06500 [Colwellia sp. MT41]